MSDCIFTFLYRYVGFPLLMVTFRALSLFNKKIAAGLEIRKKNTNGEWPWMAFQKDLSGCILIHCSSGEFEYAKSVIREIKHQKPDQKIVVTYFSPTYEKQVRNFEGIDFSCPFPWDCPKTQKAFLTKLQPTKILIARTDLWHEFLNQAQNLKIPVFLFSATLSSESSKLSNPLMSAHNRWIYSKLEKIFCVTEEDKKNFSRLTDPQKVFVIGDTRYDQVVYRIGHPRSLRENLNPKKDPTFVIGSSWPEDEKVLLPIFSDLLRKNIRVMVAPHEPTKEHLASLQKQIETLGLKTELYSQTTTWPKEKVLLIDQVGILADLYGWSSWAFVGGSFRKSVHSVMEPLAHGCQTFFGPFHTNNREALEFKTIEDCAYGMESGEEILEKILESSSLEKRTLLKEKIQGLVCAKTGATARLLEEVL